MEVYLFIVFIVVLGVIIYLSLKEYDSFKMSTIVEQDLAVVNNPEVPYQEEGFVTYTSGEFSTVNYNECLYLESNMPMSTKAWTISVYDNEWNLVGPEIISFRGNIDDKINVVFTPNLLFKEEIDKRTPRRLYNNYHYKSCKYNPDKRYTFCLRAPDTDLIDIKLQKFMSEDIRLRVAEEAKYPKPNSKSERFIIEKDNFEHGFKASVAKYGIDPVNYEVENIEDKNSMIVIFKSEMVSVDDDQRLLLFYVDHSNTIGSSYSLVTIYDENGKANKTEYTGKNDNNSYLREGIKCGIIDLDITGNFYVVEKIYPIFETGKKVNSENVINMRVLTVVKEATITGPQKYSLNGTQMEHLGPDNSNGDGEDDHNDE